MIERIVGLAAITGVLLLYVPDSERLSNRVVLPAIAMFGAWLAIKRAGVVALGVALLAGIHARPSDDDWVLGIFYPGVAVIGLVVFITVVVIRLRDHARATRAERWARRQMPVERRQR